MLMDECKYVYVTPQDNIYVYKKTPSPHGADVPISIGISFFKVKRLYSG